MTKDPKFGWHVLWIAPVMLVVIAYDRLEQHFKNRRQSKVRSNWSAETKRARTLAGLDK